MSAHTTTTHTTTPGDTTMPDYSFREIAPPAYSALTGNWYRVVRWRDRETALWYGLQATPVWVGDTDPDSGHTIGQVYPDGARIARSEELDPRDEWCDVDVTAVRKSTLDNGEGTDPRATYRALVVPREQERLRNVIADAADAFWRTVASVARPFGVTTGDLDPHSEIDFGTAAADAVLAWLDGNDPGHELRVIVERAHGRAPSTDPIPTTRTYTVTGTREEAITTTVRAASPEEAVELANELDTKTIESIETIETVELSFHGIEDGEV